MLTNAGNSARQSCLFQLFTILESKLTDLGHPLRDVNFLHLIAGVKSIIANICHTGFQHYFVDIGSVLMPGCRIGAAKVRHPSITGNNQRPILGQHPSQIFSAVPQRNAGQHRQNLILRRGFGLTCFVLIDFPATFTCVVGIVAGAPVSRLHRLGLFHGVAQGRNGHRFQGRLELGSLVPVELVAEVAGVVNSVTGLRTGGVLGLDLDKLMLFQGRQGFILYRGLLFALFVLENLVAGFTGVVGIVAVFGVGRGLGLGFHHGVAQRGKNRIFQGDFFRTGFIPEQLAANFTAVILAAARFRTCSGIFFHANRGMGQEVNSLQGFIVLPHLHLLPLCFGSVEVEIVRCTAVESPFAYGFQGAWQLRDALQGPIAIESVGTNTANSLFDDQTGKLLITPNGWIFYGVVRHFTGTRNG